MLEATWTAIAILAGSQIATLAYLGSKIDSLDTRLTGRIDEMDSRLTGRIDEMDGRLTGRMDDMNGRIDGVLTRLVDHELGPCHGHR